MARPGRSSRRRAKALGRNLEPAGSGRGAPLIHIPTDRVPQAPFSNSGHDRFVNYSYSQVWSISDFSDRHSLKALPMARIRSFCQVASSPVWSRRKELTASKQSVRLPNTLIVRRESWKRKRLFCSDFLPYCSVLQQEGGRAVPLSENRPRKADGHLPSPEDGLQQLEWPVTGLLNVFNLIERGAGL